MKTIYLTTSIVYTNALPHIGFALELVQADAVARWQRMLGQDVWFLTGTDEHGLKIAQQAKKDGKSPQVFCNQISRKYRELTKKLNISNNDFIRTTDQKKHWPGVFKLWKKLRSQGDIYEKEYEGYYCVGCEVFVLPRELKDRKCPLHQKKPELVKEKNYFFRLSKYSEKIKKLIEEDKIKIIPLSKKREAMSFLKQGLEDISFSRPKEKLKWGIPVPEDSSQVIYCWADALANYISAIGYARDEKKFKKYWPADIHFIGKDILKFHALIWPGVLLSLGIALPKKIFVHGFITSGGKKMSKTLGNTVDPFELIKEYGTDAVRYYLLREIPSTGDGDFTIEKFKERHNADLASGIGNLVSRVRKMAEKNKFEEAPCLALVKKKKSFYKKAMDDFRLDRALASVWEIVRACDKYIEEKKPWEDKKSSKKVLGQLLATLDEISNMLLPFLPATAEKIAEQTKRKNRAFENKDSGALFPRI